MENMVQQCSVWLVQLWIELILIKLILT